MKEIIEKIKVSEPEVKECLRWLSEGEQHGLNEASMSVVLRFLV